MLVIARCRCSFISAHGSYFSPRRVIFWCSHLHREGRAEHTLDQYNFDRSTDIPGDEGGGFWNTSIAVWEIFLPSVLLGITTSLPAAASLPPPSQGYKGETLDYHPRSRVRIYLHYTPYHSREPMELQIRLGVQAAPGALISVVTQLLPLLSTWNYLHAVCQSAGYAHASGHAPLHIVWQINRRAHTVLKDLINMKFLILNFLSPPLETCRARELCKATVSNRSPFLINIKRKIQVIGVNGPLGVQFSNI